MDVNGIENNHEVEVLISDMSSKIVYSSKTDTDSIKNKKFDIELENQVKSGVYRVEFTIEDLQYICHLVME